MTDPIDTTIQATVEHKLREAFTPSYLEVLNESHRHNVPPGSESHFRVTLVSTAFDGEKLLARHRRVNDTLREELAGPVHALALHTYTPDEWAARGGSPESPPCMGGGKG